MKMLFVILCISLLAGCICIRKNQNAIKWQNEVLQAERDFCEMARNKGIAEAFSFYADEDAVILRGNNLIKGKASIKEALESSGLDNARLEWEPEFVSVSESGDLAYTYGKYRISKTDEEGKKQSVDGIFHTVWKRQKDGGWKFVWD